MGGIVLPYPLKIPTFFPRIFPSGLLPEFKLPLQEAT